MKCLHYVYFNFFHETVNSHNLRQPTILLILFSCFIQCRTHLQTNQNTHTIQVNFFIKSFDFLAFQPVENTSHLHMLLRILLHCIDSSPESFVGVESRLPIRSEIPGSVSYSNVYSNNRISEVSKGLLSYLIFLCQ